MKKVFVFAKVQGKEVLLQNSEKKSDYKLCHQQYGFKSPKPIIFCALCSDMPSLCSCTYSCVSFLLGDFLCSCLYLLAGIFVFF